jgi:toxin ParE1/3/4
VRRIVWSEPARNDLQSIRAYIGQFNPTAAQRMAVRLLAAADSLSDYPDRGRPIGKGRRELTIIWPYLLRYRIANDAVFILRIRHGAQKRLP